MNETERSALSKRVAASILGARDSWTRRMFELGRQMRADGGGPVFDLSLGNPSLEPPAVWRETVAELLRDEPPGLHRYMTNAGFPEVRAFLAEREAKRQALAGLGADDVIMSVGAAGALNVLLRCVADPGDRIFVPAPYFTEYEHYAANVDAELVPVATREDDFQLDVDAIAAAIAEQPERARVLLLNSPNNPTGAIYPAAALDALAERLHALLGVRERPFWILEDSPYRDLVHDPQVVVPSMLGRWPNTVLVTSHSKDLGLAGERIGYMVISPQARGRELLQRAAANTTRTLGFVNAPALMQRALPRVLADPQGRVDVEVYARNCRRMAEGLRELGFSLPDPQAGFFLFPRLPDRLRRYVGPDDPAGGVALTERLAEQRTIVVPGKAFGLPGHLRLSMCVEADVVEGALNAFRVACRF